LPKKEDVMFLSGEDMTVRFVSQPQEALASERERVLAEALGRAADHRGLTTAKLAKIVGISEPSVSRLRRGAFVLADGSKPFELAQLLLRLFRGLDAITGGDDQAARSWLRGPNSALAGREPIELIQTARGLVDATTYVDARRAVV
jgi:uncharacterized protein (DUF2384 family)